MNKESSDNTRIEIIPAEKTSPPNKWLVKGDRKEDDILIIHNENGKYEVKYKK